MIKSLLTFFAGWVLDARNFIEEKKVWGSVYLTFAVVIPFFIPIEPILLGSVVLIGVACFLGLPIGNNTLVSENLKSLGLLDLFTDFHNKGDPARVFGAVFLLGALGYLIAPTFNPAITPSTMVFWIFSGGGLGLLFGASAFHSKVGHTLG